MMNISILVLILLGLGGLALLVGLVVVGVIVLRDKNDSQR
jgi:hypothetical protein